MKIIVDSSSHKNIRITIPTGLILNRFTALIAAKNAQKNGATLTYEQACGFISALKDFKRMNSGWKLIEVESADGHHVEIIL